MSQDLSRQAGQMVDLIKAIIQDEKAKSDQIMTGTIFDRNEEDDTYSIYVDTDMADGKLTLMTNIPNESKHVYSRGDHVYIMKVRGQIAQAFIIGSIGARGVSVNAQVETLRTDLQALTGTVRSLGIPNNRFSVKAVPIGENSFLGFMVSWNGPVLPEAIQLIFTLNRNKRYSTYVKSFDPDKGVYYREDSSISPPSPTEDYTHIKPRTIPAYPNGTVECHFDPGVPYQSITFWYSQSYSDETDYQESISILGGLSVMDAGLKIDI